MKPDVCQALIENDRKSLQVLFNAFLNTLDTKSDPNSNWIKIQEWIEGNDCVEKVEISGGMLRSEPPIKKFVIRLKAAASEKQKEVLVGVTVHANKLEFNHR